MTKKGFILESIKFAITSFFNHIWLMLKTLLIAFAMLIAGTLFSFVIIFAFLGLIALFIKAFGYSIEFALLFEWGNYLYNLIGISIIVLWIEIGFLRIALDIYNHNESTLRRMLCDISLLIRVIIASILFAIVTIVGFMLFIIPGIIWLVRGQFYVLAIVDKGYNRIDAFRYSWAITKGHFWPLFIWSILTWILSLLFLLFVGQFSALSSVYVYHYLTNKYLKRHEKFEPVI